MWNKTDYFLLHDVLGIVILTAFKQHYLFIRNKKMCFDLLLPWELDPFAFLFVFFSPHPDTLIIRNRLLPH